MSYRIRKQTAEQIVLQDNGGLIDFIIGFVIAAIGAGIVYLAWFDYQDTGELFTPVAMAVVGSCFFFPVFKTNRVTINANRKEIVKIKSWFCIVSQKEVVTNNSLSLLEMSGFTTGQVEAFFDPQEAVAHHYCLKFHSYPEWELVISDFSSMISIALFIERFFTTDIALVVQNRRHKFSAQGLLKSHKHTALPNDNIVREEGFQTLRIGGHHFLSIGFWVALLGILGCVLVPVIFILCFSEDVFTPYVPMFIQYLFAVLAVGTAIWFVMKKTMATRLQVINDRLVVKLGPFSKADFHFSEVVGVANVAENTYLITQDGAEKLAYQISTTNGYAIHSWLLPFLKK